MHDILCLMYFSDVNSAALFAAFRGGGFGPLNTPRKLSTPAFSTLATWCHVFHSRVSHPCHLVPRFPLPRFPPLSSGAAFSTPAFSTPVIWCRVFHSRVFHPLLLGAEFSTPTFSTPAFSAPPPLESIQIAHSHDNQFIYSGWLWRHFYLSQV